MAVNTSFVSSAYANARSLQGADKAAPNAKGAGAEGAREAAAQGPDFATTAKNVAQAVSEGEKAASAMIVGEADPHSVIEALAVAELAVETAVTVRDKVVEAYQEILRMPI